jgi:protein-S-isoprenylcysteine O-methyltransferase Ste14
MKDIEMQGMENLVDHLPEVRTGRGGIFGLIILVSFFVATAAMVALDWLWPAWTGFGQIVAIIVGFGWTGQFFWRRREYQARWGDLAYQKAFRKHILVGLPVIFAAITHNAYLPGQRLPLGWAALVVVVVGLYFVVTGVVLWGRAILTFGFDNLAMLYVYFPAEGRMVESSIYAIIRHPVYAAVIRIGLALGLWRGTWFSIAFGLFMPVGLTLWLRLVEEPELIERFGPGYATYRRSVPAFSPWLRDVGKFL